MRHTYHASLTWDGNLGDGTSTYAGYGRDYHVDVEGKAVLRGSADAIFRGAADLHNPEDLFLASIAACHMLSYLALCARCGVRVLAYEDSASGTLALRPDGGGAFQSVTLSPVVTVASDTDVAAAIALHQTAHAACFIASSCRVPIVVDATCCVQRSPLSGELPRAGLASKTQRSTA